VQEKPDATLASIEETQAALRESIETAKQLAEKSDFLLQKAQAAPKTQAEAGGGRRRARRAFAPGPRV